MYEILSLFHHIHHKNGEHRVHHCGGRHKEIDASLDYTIEHCSCGLHSIDKEFAIAHATGTTTETISLLIRFLDECPDGGWHLESGILHQ